MKTKAEHEKTLYKAGIFIILTVTLLIYSILWLRYFALLPDKNIIVKFKECGPISTGMPVYYNGVDIGKADKIDFSKDFRYTLVSISIYKKGLDLPNNIYGELKTQGLTGQKYLNIVYPEHPSATILKTNDVIEGRLSSIEYIIKGLNEFISKGDLNQAVKDFRKNAVHISKVIQKIDNVLEILQKILKLNESDIRKLINQGAMSASNINITTDSIKKISSSPELNKNINSAVTNILSGSEKFDKSMSDTNETILGANKIINGIGNVTGNLQFQESIISTAHETDSFLKNLNSGDLNTSVNKILHDTDRTINRYDCLGDSFGDLMHQRFLILRLMFGKPGKSFEKCTNWDCLMQQQQQQKELLK